MFLPAALRCARLLQTRRLVSQALNRNIARGGPVGTGWPTGIRPGCCGRVLQAALSSPGNNGFAGMSSVL